MKYTVNPKLSLLENLCEICLGERLHSDIVDPSGVTLIPANTKLSKTRLKIIALYRGRGVTLPTAKDAEEKINAILLFPNVNS
jgi:hypothetical protein